jgi:hypothetical protein
LNSQSKQIENKIDESTTKVMQHSTTVAKTNTDRTITTLTERYDKSDKERQLENELMATRLAVLEEQAAKNAEQFAKAEERAATDKQDVMDCITASARKASKPRPSEIVVETSSECSGLQSQNAISAASFDTPSKNSKVSFDFGSVPDINRRPDETSSRRSRIPPPKDPMSVTPRRTRQSKRIASATKAHLKQTEARRAEEETRDAYSIHRRIGPA